MNEETKDLITRLRVRAAIRRQISTRTSVKEGKPDRLADLLDEAAQKIKDLERGSYTPWWRKLISSRHLT